MPAQSDDNDLAPSGGVDLAATFAKIDVDGSGSISKEELWEHLSGKGEGKGGTAGLSEKDFDILFWTIDEDKSGCIDFDEYSRFMEGVRKARGGDRRVRRNSAMKVSTLRDSLLSCEKENDQPKKEQQDAKRQGVGRSQSMRRFGSLVKIRKQKGVSRKLSLDLESTEGEDIKCQLEEFDRRGVRFHDVEVRKYSVVASDNPAVTFGVALGLDWDYTLEEREHLDTFEDRRGPQRSKNYVKERRLKRREREDILRSFGATDEEIEEAKRRSKAIRDRRKRSVALKDQDDNMELMEDVGNFIKFIKKKFGRRRSSLEGRSSFESAVDMERLHPTLMAMLEVEGDGEE